MVGDTFHTNTNFKNKTAKESIKEHRKWAEGHKVEQWTQEATNRLVDFLDQVGISSLLGLNKQEGEIEDATIIQAYNDAIKKLSTMDNSSKYQRKITELNNLISNYASATGSPSLEAFIQSRRNALVKEAAEIEQKMNDENAALNYKRDNLESAYNNYMNAAHDQKFASGKLAENFESAINEIDKENNNKGENTNV